MLEILPGRIDLGPKFFIQLESTLFASGKKRNLFFAPNGSGKTVMFRFLSGQIISDQNSKNSPTILFQKQLVHPPITKNFAFVPQSAKDGLFGLPVYEELRCATGKIDARKIDEL